MLDLASGWELAVERGPDWLFVRISSAGDDGSETPPLAHQLWSLLEEHLTHRLVLELDQVVVLGSRLIDQLELLDKWISQRGGVMRLCGLSARNRRVLKRRHLDERFPVYGNRLDAVMCRPAGRTPQRPR